MGKQVMRRHASDNEYLHKDFHGALSNGLDYLGERFGEEAVRDYLRQFARAYYRRLRDQLKTHGLRVLRDHLCEIHGREGVTIETHLADDRLEIHVPRCPAVAHLRDNGHSVSPHFVETTRTVHETLCEGTPYDFVLVAYNPATGESTQRFARVERQESSPPPSDS